MKSRNYEGYTQCADTYGFQDNSWEKQVLNKFFLS